MFSLSDGLILVNPTRKTPPPLNVILILVFFSKEILLPDTNVFVGTVNSLLVLFAEFPSTLILVSDGSHSRSTEIEGLAQMFMYNNFSISFSESFLD
jgi:hypothetical protein